MRTMIRPSGRGGFASFKQFAAKLPTMREHRKDVCRLVNISANDELESLRMLQEPRVGTVGVTEGISQLAATIEI